MPIKVSLLIFILLQFLVSCAHLKPSFKSKTYYQQGIASWYGDDFHGKKTANGETYDMHDMTCAHKTAPFGTHILVQNLVNGKRTVVRVNDRGPYAPGRIIDLSFTAAEKLDLIGMGISEVVIKFLEGAKYGDDLYYSKYLIQVATFSEEKRAQNLLNLLKVNHPNSLISTEKKKKSKLYKVFVGPYEKREDALSEKELLVMEGHKPIIVLD